MSKAIPERASAVIIGGGVIGASVAYHLAKQGWSDVVLLERSQFSCGTSWHAAGLVGTMRANESQARLCEYSMAVLTELEQETGQSTGFKQVGSLSIAHSQARFEELKRVAAMNNAFGVTRVDMITPDEIKALYPYLETSDLLGGSWVPQDGTASPVDVVQAFIKGA
jgi:4-methylaminobutanoate oxidase (formaldehyde-forming)